jgi:hypothetical protein
LNDILDDDLLEELEIIKKDELKENEENVRSRTTIKLALNQIFLELIEPKKDENSVEEYLIEISGFEFHFIQPEGKLLVLNLSTRQFN